MMKSICNKLFLKRCLFGLRMREGTPLKEHLDELNFILMELCDIDVNIEEKVSNSQAIVMWAMVVIKVT